MNITQLPHFDTLIRRPYALQFVADELPLMLLCTTGLAVSGMDEAPLGRLLFWFSFTIALCLAYRFFYMRLTVFRITAGQIIYEHGVFHRTRDYMELYRVVDFREDRNFMQQLFGIKTVWVYSGDRTIPCLRLIGMDNRDDLISMIRERMTYNRQKNGIYEITNR